MYYTKTAEETERLLKTDLKNGLSSKEARARLIKNGENKLSEQKRRGALYIFLSQLNDFMVIILLIAAAVSFFLSVINHEGAASDSIIILAIVVLNSIVGTVQEIRAQRSLDALKKLSAPKATVIRDAKNMTIDAKELVIGDVITLVSGDIVPADCRIITSTEAEADESSLTGESQTAQKSGDTIRDTNIPLGDRKNMLYSSTFITHGKATAVVCATGMDTEMGHIASMLSDTEEADTPLQKRLAHIGKVLGIAAILICALIFVIGLARHLPTAEMFVTSVSLAVAAIPEGLVAIVTITLAIGVTKLSKHNAIIRHLPSVETLGSASVICTDKTGTLTENKMSVQYTYSEDKARLLKYAAVCTENDTKNPTELAILSAAGENGIAAEPKDFLNIVPFDSDKKYMSVTVKDEKYFLSVTKGAPERIIEKCDRFYDGKKAAAITPLILSRLKKAENTAAKKGLRLIAAAYRLDLIRPRKMPESHFIFLGLIGIEDPPRAEVIPAVSECKRAGIIPVMITGDHADTAKSIAVRCGICDKDGTVITGAELDKTDDDTLLTKIRDCRVYARVTPAHKLRIVSAWQRLGEIVAMTGDGVNDAPALKKADIGCSMGRGGTEVAKDASDMILADDNFATIVTAVKEGRGIFENIKKAIQFLLSSNIGEILTVFFGLLFGLGAPLTASQLLWINLVTDSLPAIALGVDESGEDIMDAPPKKGSVLSGGLWANIVFEGMMIGALSLTAFCIALCCFNDMVTARTMAFMVLGISELVHAFNMKSEKSVIPILFLNKQLNLSFAIGLMLQIAVVSVGALRGMFGVCPLSAGQWLIVTALSVMPLIIVEAQKCLNTFFKR